MNKLYKSVSAAVFLSLLGLTACDDQLDINVNPTQPSTASPDLVLPTGTVNIAFVMGGSFNIIGNFFAQHWTEDEVHSQYKDYDRYRVGQSTTDREYRNMYLGGLKNLRYVMDRARGDSSNYAAIAGLESAYAFQVMTDAYDQIPFSEALQGAANTQPRFDSQEAVYDGLITMIDDAMAKINANGIKVGSQDVVFGGDMDKWRRFGNTLKLKIYLRQVYRREGVAAAGIRALYSNGAQFLGATEDAQVTGFSNTSQNFSPLYTYDVYSGSGIRENIVASSTSIDYLNATNDPRIDDFFSRPNGSSTAAHVGTRQGQAVIGGTSNAITTKSRPNLTKIAGPASPVVFLSGAESLFLQAEAALRNYATGQTAQSLYEQAIAASFAHFNRAVPASFLSSTGIAYNAGGTTEEQLDQIITQKWVALNGTEGFEAWTELRRTDYPSFITPPSTSDLPTGVIIKRLVFPLSETQQNGNTPEVVPVTVPVWWDAK
jgi:hypothetical protein